MLAKPIDSTYFTYCYYQQRRRRRPRRFRVEQLNIVLQPMPLLLLHCPRVFGRPAVVGVHTYARGDGAPVTQRSRLETRAMRVMRFLPSSAQGVHQVRQCRTHLTCGTRSHFLVGKLLTMAATSVRRKTCFTVIGCPVLASTIRRCSARCPGDVPHTAHITPVTNIGMHWPTISQRMMDEAKTSGVVRMFSVEGPRGVSSRMTVHHVESTNRARARRE